MRQKTKSNRLLSPADLEGLDVRDNLMVDSSALCAAIHEKIVLKAGNAEKVVNELYIRLFALKCEPDVIKYGQYVSLRLSDVIAVFGSRERIPIGVLRKELKYSQVHSTRKMG